MQNKPKQPRWSYGRGHTPSGASLAAGLRGKGFWHSLEEISGLLSSGNSDLPHFRRHRQNRRRLIPLRRATADEAKENRNSNSQGSAEGDEIPKRGESQNKDQRAANCKYKAYKSATDWELVHADAGMTICSQGATS
jgi:hypothetical protein